MMISRLQAAVILTASGLALAGTASAIQAQVPPTPPGEYHAALTSGGQQGEGGGVGLTV